MEPTEETIMKDIDITMNFITNSLKFEENNIIVFGRSIGTGPATYMAYKYNVFMLCLFSPYENL